MINIRSANVSTTANCNDRRYIRCDVMISYYTIRTSDRDIAATHFAVRKVMASSKVQNVFKFTFNPFHRQTYYVLLFQKFCLLSQ